MAYSITAKPNTTTPDGDFPFGNIKDNDGSNNGTPVNVLTNGDIHQFFAKMAYEAGVTLNDLPDSEYSGWQFYESLLKVFGGLRRVVYSIGAWDMDTDAVLIKNQAVDMDKFRGATFYILSDNQQNAYINGGDLSVGETKCTLGVVSTGFTLTRAAGSTFDGTNFNDIGVNRGYIIIDYSAV